MRESYWPADTSEPVRELTVGGLLREAAADAPEAPALVVGTPGPPGERRRLTYAELLAGAERTARALLERFEPGERVAVWSPNSLEWVLLEFGAALAGVTLVTVNPAYRASELAYVLGQSRASGVFYLPEHRGTPMAALVEEVRPGLPELREALLLTEWDEFLAAGRDGRALPEVAPLDAAQIQYTSGTTGFSKGALLHHRGIVNSAAFFTTRFGVGRGDVYVNPMPLFHTGGCVQGVLGCATKRAVHVLMPAFDPGLMLDLLEQERADVTVAVPTMLVAVMEHPSFSERDLSSLRGVVSGGSMVPPQLVRRFEEALGVRFQIVFGQTELSPVVTQTRREDTFEDRTTTVGQALPQVEIKITDPNTGETVPVGAVGEFCARGYQVMTGYFDMPEKTAETIDTDGWLHTGDLCSMDERGYVKVEGRLRDMIIRGGENVYPREIEEVLLSHPKVAEVAVVGLPDEKWGEQIAAFVRAAPGATPTEAELFAHVREHLAPHKTPRTWAFVDAFPLTPSGKIQKYVLRDDFVRKSSADAPALEPAGGQQ